jgi:hypothetical protein
VEVQSRETVKFAEQAFPVDSVDLRYYIISRMARYSCRERKACKLTSVTSRGTQVAAGGDDDLRSQEYSKRQAMRYEKKRHVGSQDKITSA